MPVVINGTTGITTPDLDSTADISANGVVFGEGGGSVATNVVAGAGALASNTTGSLNTAVGNNAGNASLVGIANTFVGSGAGLSATGADGRNTFVGQNAGQLVTTGVRNTILGRHNGTEQGLDISTSSSNVVLADGNGTPRQVIDTNGRVTSGVQDGAFGQFGKGYSTWSNASSHTMNLASLFPLLPIGGAGMTIMMQIVTQSGANNTTSYYAMAKRNIDQSGWAFSVIASQISGPSISFSGSANSITLTFSFGNQYGKCMLDVLCAT